MEGVVLSGTRARLSPSTLRRACTLALSLLAGCNDGSYDLVVHVPGAAARARRVEVAVLPSCDGGAREGEPATDARTTVVVSEGESRRIGWLAAGDYGLYGRAWEEGCRLYAAGCTAVRIEDGGEGTLDLVLHEVPARGCDDGQTCTGGLCVGVDGGAGDLDGGQAGSDGGEGRDSGLDGGEQGGDAGSDAGSDAGADSGVSPGCEGPQPEVVATWPTNYANAVALASPVLLVADNMAGLKTVDITNPEEPAEYLGDLDTEGRSRDVAALGSDAAVADGADGLVLIDVSSAGSVILGAAATSDNAFGVDVADPFVLVVTDSTLDVFDVTNPATPSLAGSLPGLTSADGIVAAWPLAYVQTIAGLRIVDLTDPGAPEIVGRAGEVGCGQALAVSGDRAYIAGPCDTVVVVDVTDPTAPSVLGSAEMPDWVLGLAFAGPWLLVADSYSGLIVVDVSDAGAPVIVATLDTTGTASDVAFDGRYAYVADGDSGIAIVDLGCYGAGG